MSTRRWMGFGVSRSDPQRRSTWVGSQSAITQPPPCPSAPSTAAEGAPGAHQLGAHLHPHRHPLRGHHVHVLPPPAPAAPRHDAPIPPSKPKTVPWHSIGVKHAILRGPPGGDLEGHSIWIGICPQPHSPPHGSSNFLHVLRHPMCPQNCPKNCKIKTSKYERLEKCIF